MVRVQITDLVSGREQALHSAHSTTSPAVRYNSTRIAEEVFLVELVIRMNLDEQRAIVRGLYNMRNAMEQDDPQKRELELLILRVIDAPEVEPFWRRFFKWN